MAHCAAGVRAPRVGLDRAHSMEYTAEMNTTDWDAQATRTRTLEQVLVDTLEQGGLTVFANSLGDYPPAGWAVGRSGGHPTQTFAVDELGADHPSGQRTAFIRALLHLFQDGVPVLGTWVDGGTVYLDAVDVIHSTDRAIAECLDRGEIAVYNLETGVTVRPSRD